MSNSKIASNTINAIFVDLEGAVWFATDSGASGLKNNSWTTLRDSLAFPVFHNGGSGMSAEVTSIAQSKDASLWFGTAGGGLVRFNRTSATQVWKRYNIPNIPYDVVSGVTSELTSQGQVWVATRGQGAARYIPSETRPDEGTWNQFNNNNSGLPNNLWSTATNLVDGHFWLGSNHDGVYEYKPNEDQWIPHQLPANYQYGVNSMAFDLEDNAWIAKNDSGVSVLRISTGEWVKHYTRFTPGALIPYGPVNAVTTDMHKMRWFGCDNGLVLFNDTTWTLFTSSNTPGLPNSPITSLAYDRRGNLWIGTLDSGAVAYNPAGVRFQ